MRKEWRIKKAAKRAEQVRIALATWKHEADDCKRLRIKVPPKPKVHKDFPRALTPDYLKVRKSPNIVVEDEKDEAGEDINVGEMLSNDESNDSLVD